MNGPTLAIHKAFTIIIIIIIIIVVVIIIIIIIKIPSYLLKINHYIRHYQSLYQNLDLNRH